MFTKANNGQRSKVVQRKLHKSYPLTMKGKSENIQNIYLFFLKIDIRFNVLTL